MTKQEFKAKLTELKDFMYRVDAIVSAMDSTCSKFGDKLIDHHIQMISKQVADEEGRVWWFIFENDWGNLAREINGVEVISPDQLFNLIQDDIRKNNTRG